MAEIGNPIRRHTVIPLTEPIPTPQSEPDFPQRRGKPSIPQPFPSVPESIPEPMIPA
jgi:hypothetical protein